MKEKIIPFLKQFLPFSVLLFFAQKILVETYFTGITFYYETLSIYLFHFICTLLFFFFLVFVNQTFFDKTGYAFLATGILKMMASVVFLLPLIQSDLDDKKPDVIAFFIPFFLFLLFETIHSVRLLGQK
ncbi:hypothetical protein FLJC2902T_04570 [Flavobacterium limnosediminis JC2902]|uniref:Uncharacterized protein n=1 Tax=Flavobacterium limnosediminis JC2902 TaxID=1341181 RepID=V6SUW6_9FLAO|nr:hypothetical protein [Flavobacterium limnosediminis]ESU29972.1 hypothetical protein FLJC2902T_04570 [Flavobacterium limnosediminis JC2902]